MGISAIPEIKMVSNVAKGQAGVSICRHVVGSQWENVVALPRREAIKL